MVENDSPDDFHNPFEPGIIDNMTLEPYLVKVRERGVIQILRSLPHLEKRGKHSKAVNHRMGRTMVYTQKVVNKLKARKLTDAPNGTGKQGTS